MHPIEYRNIPEDLKKGKKLSVLMPFLNEEKAIVENIRQTIQILEELAINFEIVLTDDGSKDLSTKLIQDAFKNDKRIILTRNYQNFGKGWALKTAYEFSSGDYILFLDSDLELSPYHIPNFLRIMTESNADAVIGSKLHPDSKLFYPLKRRIMSFAYYTIIKILFGLPVMDTQTGIKLFKREALERSLPKVLVKKFAFDIELLIILHKCRMKIESAPIELKFTRGSFGNIKLRTIFRTFQDTLAVFYRDKILGFYDRPFGPNHKYFYSILLTPESYSDYEKECLLRFLNIDYPDYEIILAGSNDFGVQSPKIKFLKTEELKIKKRLMQIIKSGMIHGEISVYSRLDAYPDERFLYNVGRIMSQENIGGAGGFLTLRNNPGKFEKTAFDTVQSVFLNLNLSYRYKPLNYKKVHELQPDGFFIFTEILQSVEWEKMNKLKLEYILSKEVEHRSKILVYSPDIYLYKRFPETLQELFHYFRKDAMQRADQGKKHFYSKLNGFQGLKFLVSVFLILLIFISAFFSIFFKNVLFLIPVFTYYTILLLSRIFFYGFRRGCEVFLTIATVQLVYCRYFLTGYFFGKKKKLRN